MSDDTDVSSADVSSTDELPLELPKEVIIESESEEEVVPECSGTSIYFETDKSSKQYSTCSTLLTTHPAQSIITTDFEDTSISQKTTSKDEIKSIVREFSNEFHKPIDIEPNLSASSELYFTHIKESESFAGHDRKKQPHNSTRNFTLQDTLILNRFEDIFDLPISSKEIKKICFKETLIITYEPGCDRMINFGASDLEIPKKNKCLISDFGETVGEISINIEDTESNVLTYCKSKLALNDSYGGTELVSWISYNFEHIEEKKTEWFFENQKKNEKILHVVMENDNYVAFLKHKDARNVTDRRGELNLKACGDFLQDGGIYVLMRYLILKKFVGKLEFLTMDIDGKIGLCKMDVGVQREIVISNIFYCTIRIQKELFRCNMKKDISKTYFLSTGHIVLHTWKGCSYSLHLDPKNQIPPTFQKYLSTNWMNDIILSTQYEDNKNSINADIQSYFEEHPSIKKLLQDYLLYLLMLKPDNVLEHSINYFLNLFHEADAICKSKESLAD